MRPFPYYKISAKRLLRGKTLTSAAVALFSLLLTLFLSLYIQRFYTDNEIINTVISTAISIFVVYPFSMGITVYFMNLAQKKNPKVGDVFDGYKYFFKILPYVIFSVVISFLSNFSLEYLKSLSAEGGDIFTDILIIIVMLIPTFIQLYLSFTLYIIYDGDASGIKAMLKSIKLTKGNILYLISLNFSFLPWFLLVFITLGGALFFLIPYMELTMIVAYKDIKSRPGKHNINEEIIVVNEEREFLNEEE